MPSRFGKSLDSAGEKLHAARRVRGFTLIALLVVIAIIAAADRSVVACRSSSARGGATQYLQEQPEANRARTKQLSRAAPLLSLWRGSTWNGLARNAVAAFG